MTPQEIAQKHGVALPETCIKLDWKLPTNFYWLAYETKQGIQYALYVKINSNYNLFYADFDTVFSQQKGGFIPAPKMHEIAPLLPSKLDLETDLLVNAPHSFYVSTWDITKLMVGYYDNYIVRLCCIVEPNHFAEAYAQLYLKLKEKNLL